MNKVIMIGNLCNDPEAYTTQNGVSRSSFRIAVQRPHKRDETDFFSVVAWRASADFCNRYLKKGSRISVEGYLQTRTYDAQDGSKRYVTEIIAEGIEGLTRHSDETQGDTQGRQANKRGQTQNTGNNAGPDDFIEVHDDELPF